jgi:hypothetical protein
MSDKKTSGRVDIERKQGEIDIIIDGENAFISSVCPEVIELLLSLNKKNKKLSKFKK